MNQEYITNLIEETRKGNREAYNELVNWFNENKDTMIPGVAKNLRKSINYAKKHLM